MGSNTKVPRWEPKSPAAEACSDGWLASPRDGPLCVQSTSLRSQVQGAVPASSWEHRLLPLTCPLCTHLH